MKRKIGLSTFGLQDRFGDLRALDIAKAAGADAVDFSLHKGDYTNEGSIYSRSEEEIIEYYKSVKAHADAIGIEICQTHGRLKGYHGDEIWDRDMRENARLDSLATSVLGAPVCVVHSVPLGFFGPDVDPDFMHDLNYKMFGEILEDAKKYGVKIASETFGDSPKHGVCDFFGDIDNFTRSFERIKAEGDNADWFCTCVDTGHSNKAMRFGNPTPADVIRRLGANTVCLHLNDNDTFTDQHKPLLTGTIDWDDVFDALDEVGYSGVYNMEISLQRFGEEIICDTAAFSVKILRNILDKRYG